MAWWWLAELLDIFYVLEKMKSKWGRGVKKIRETWTKQHIKNVSLNESVNVILNVIIIVVVVVGSVVLLKTFTNKHFRCIGRNGMPLEV